jgi:hypothetical protein
MNWLMMFLKVIGILVAADLLNTLFMKYFGNNMTDLTLYESYVFMVITLGVVLYVVFH